MKNNFSTHINELKNQFKNYFSKHEWVLLISGFIIFFLVRAWFVSDNSVFFMYDQARDAVVSESIFIDQKVKVQGPSASGTKDTLYHGVLFYYLVGPVYYLFQSPQAVSYFLSFLSSFMVFPIYILVKDMFKQYKSFSKKKEWQNFIYYLPFTLIIMLAFSADSVMATTWISNPAIAAFGVVFFIHSFMKAFQNKSLFWLISAALWWAVLTQAILFSVFWAVLWMYFLIQEYVFQSKLPKVFTIRNTLIAAAVYLIGISSMIVTQFLLWKRGIFTTQAIQELGSSSDFILIDRTMSVVQLLSRKAQTTLFSSSLSDLIPVNGEVAVYFTALLLGVCIALVLFSKFIQSLHKQLLLLAVVSPVFFLMVHFRDSYHFWIGTELFFIMIAVFAFVEIWRFAHTRFQKNHTDSNIVHPIFFSIGIVFLVLYLGMQISVLVEVRQTRSHLYAIQKGLLLRENNNLIDSIYSKANGEQFSFSTMTNPFGINVTWGYLFSSYGKNKYGYVPTFFGPPQEGLVGADLLEEVLEPNDLHFTIYEPDTQLPDFLVQEFIQNQNQFMGSPSATLEFGSLILEERNK